ncbi:Programmed cell death protein 6 [Strongyloides ratti]|uniref:Programmed cell death protein 6 n=1 Tax=Strongyloides ratti TaxID=34506 RepID=A0A090L709_STRRB|nr:Programmed cell death protein 6 [Strongyloides ratti]CEF63908.1 Programmed cell death protein 6 [Strongyloides ratti]
MAYNYSIHYAAADAFFLILDRNRSGTISMDEFQRGMSNGTTERFDMDTVSLLFAMIDREGHKKLNMSQFRVVFSFVEAWKRAFHAVDRDRSGAIEVREFKELLYHMGYKISDASIMLFVNKFARKRPMTLFFDDFIRSVISLQLLTDAFKVKDIGKQGFIQLSYEEFLLILGQSGICR